MLTTKQARRNPALRQALARVDSRKPPLLSGDEVFEFRVLGLPVTQGDLAGKFESGRLRLHNPAELKAWRKRVAWKAKQSMGLRGAVPPLAPMLLGLEFILPREGRMAHLPMPVFKSDFDKLTRSVFDALTGVCYEDDGAIIGSAITDPTGKLTVSLPNFKRWAQNGEAPGVTVRIRLCPEVHYE